MALGLLGASMSSPGLPARSGLRTRASTRPVSYSLLRGAVTPLTRGPMHAGAAGGKPEGSDGFP